MKVYKLISNDNWYDGKDFTTDEEASPIFTNLDRVLKTIRSNLQTASEYVQLGGANRKLYAPRLKAWQNVEIVTYDLNEVSRTRSTGKKK